MNKNMDAEYYKDIDLPVMKKLLTQKIEKIDRIIDTEKDNMFHIEEICNVWYELYGEELEEGFPGFIDELKQRIS